MFYTVNTLTCKLVHTIIFNVLLCFETKLFFNLNFTLTGDFDVEAVKKAIVAEDYEILEG